MFFLSRCGKVKHPIDALAALPSVPNFNFTAKTSESVLERTGTRPTASERWNTIKNIVVSEEIKDVNKKTSIKEHGRE